MAPCIMIQILCFSSFPTSMANERFATSARPEELDYQI